MFEIIDFHTHPFFHPEDNICRHRDFCHMSPEGIPGDLRSVGISKMCGSVIRQKADVARALGVSPDDLSDWDVIHACNEDMWQAKALLGDFYVPGMMVHPNYVNQSIAEMEDFYARGVRLIGELVPYSHGWEDYACKGFSDILDRASELGMIVSIHSMDNDQMDEMVRRHPGCVIVFAHPGEYPNFTRHMERLAMSENAYLDLSGTGLFRHGMLRHALDLFGADRFLFGSDYPVCNPAMFVGGVRDDPLLTDGEKTAILAGNARRLFAEAGLDL